MFDKLKSVEIRYDDLNELLSDAKIIAQQSEYQKYAKEQSDLTPIVKRFKDLKKIVQQLDCLLYTSPSPRDLSTSRMPSSA